MAYPPTRSMNTDLHVGMIDGKYKRIRPNTGGFIEPTTYANRDELCDIWYGVHEAAEVDLPDGRHMAMPYYCRNTPARACDEGI